MFKRSTSKSVANEAPIVQSTAVKPVAVLDADDKNFLCQLEETYRPHYLQMPIKIEPRVSSNQKPRKQSQSYSEEIKPQNESKLMKDDFNMATTREDVEILESQLRAFHLIEKGASPLIKIQNPPFVKEQEPEPNVQQTLKASILDEDIFRLPNRSGEINPHKSLLLKLINDYQAYDQSLKVATNFHMLQKRDCLFKIFGNILGVIARENKKMENGLCVELRKAGFGVDRTPINQRMTKEEERHPIYPCKVLFRSTPEGKNSKSAIIEEKPVPEKIFYEDQE